MEANAEGRTLSIKMWGKLSVGKLFCEHAKSCAVILKENRRIRYIITYYPAIDTFQSILFFYGQEYFSRFGLSKIAISLIMLIHGAASSLGAMSSNAITGLLGKRTRFVASLGVVTGYVLVSTGNLAASLAGFWCVGIWTSVLRPLRSAELNAELPSGQRATILSVDSMIYSIFMLMLFPAVGFLADAVGLQMAFGTGSVLVLILVLCAGRRGELA